MAFDGVRMGDRVLKRGEAADCSRNDSRHVASPFLTFSCFALIFTLMIDLMSEF